MIKPLPTANTSFVSALSIVLVKYYVHFVSHITSTMFSLISLHSFQPLRFVQEGLCYTFGVLFPFFLCLVLNALGQRVLFSLYNTKEAGAVLGFFPLPCFHLAYLLQVVFSLYHIQKSHKLKKANLLVHAFVVSVLSTLVCTSWMLFQTKNCTSYLHVQTLRKRETITFYNSGLY